MSLFKVKFFNYYHRLNYKIIKRLESDNAIKILENLEKEKRKSIRKITSKR